MTKREMEKKLAEYLDERWAIILMPNSSEAERLFYNGFCAAIAQIGGWERQEDGKHFVKLN